MTLLLSTDAQTWPIAGTFTISRGSRTEVNVVVATLDDGTHKGRGECVPYARYGETIESVIEQIQSCQQAINNGLDKRQLQDFLPAGAARNALDCAFWDLEAKQTGRPAHDLANIPVLAPQITAYTLSLGTPEAMYEAAKKAAKRALLKIKLGDVKLDHERIEAVRLGAPNAQLIVDANEGWTPQYIEENLAFCAEANVSMIEQPLPADNDTILNKIAHPVPICADESAHVASDCAKLADRYDMVNIKLDKTGGLTEAMAMVESAKAAKLGIMIGCMLATSLAMAPALLIAQNALFVDLDGPLLLAKDRDPGLQYYESNVAAAQEALWG